MTGNIVVARSLCSGRTGLSEETKLRIAAIVAIAALSCAACSTVTPVSKPTGPDRLDDASVRRFAAEQEAAWNGRDFDRFYSLCSPDAVFVSIHWRADGSITREQRTPQQDRSADERFFAAHPGKFIETDTIDSIKLSPNGLNARILGHATMRFATSEKGEMLNATTDQTVVLKDGHILSMGQTDTSER
jgi:hypothetical protein